MGDTNTILKLAALGGLATVAAPAALAAMGTTTAAAGAAPIVEAGVASGAMSAAAPAISSTMAAGALPTAAGGASMLGTGMKIAGLGLRAGQAYSGMQASRAEQDVYKAQIQQEKMRARDEAIQRRERLLNAVSLQSARVGASGITNQGTPEQVFNADLTNFNYEDLAARATSGQTQTTMMQQGKAARSRGNLAATISLLDGGANYWKIG